MKDSGRGVVTPAIEESLNKFKADNLIDFDNTTFLRFLPYLDYLGKNSQKVDWRKISAAEIRILDGLNLLGVVGGGFETPVAFKHDFYTWVQEVLYQAYVLEVDDD